MTKIKNGDFLELDFTGKIAESGHVFDTTDEELAKEKEIFQPKATYKPVKLVVGENHVVSGLDDAFLDKEPGKYTVKVEPEDAFGKKSAQLLKIIPMKEFKRQEIKPFVGLEVNIDGMPGTIRSVSGGRVIVDFNHPLAGKDLEYDLDIKRIITSDEGKVKAVLELMRLQYKELNVKDKKAEIKPQNDIPDNLRDNITDEIERLTGVKAKLVFEDEKKKADDKKTEAKTSSKPEKSE